MATTINSDIHVADGTSYTLNADTYNNEATIYVDSGGNLTNLLVNGAVTLAGGGAGKVTLTDSPSNRVFSNTGGSVLTNQNNLISGAGEIFSNNSLSLVNGDDGVIDGNAVNNALVIRNIAVTNTGALQSTDDGGLTIRNASVANAGGLILATGASIAARSSAAAITAAGSGNGHVDIITSTVTGGDLTTLNNGVISASGGSLLDSVHITGGSQVILFDGASASITGTINNEGRILLDAAGNLTDLVVQGATSLTGGGVVTLSAGSARIYSNTGASVLTNVNNTIAVAGGGELFSNNNLSVVNQAAGKIESDAGTFDVHNVQVTNAGHIAAGFNATMLLRNMTLVDDGGHVDAVTSGGTVILQTSTIQGGTFTTKNGGAIVANGGTLLDGTGTHPIHIALGSTIEIRDGTDASLAGALDNKGALSVASSGNLSSLVIQGAATLQGGGGVTLSGTNARIYSNTASTVLTNTDNTISGSGQIFSNNNLAFTNETGGTVRAVGGTFDLHDIAVTNHGILEAGTGGTLFIRNAGLTSDATVRAIVSGGEVTLRNSTISGGTLTTANGGKMSFDSNAILDGTAGHAVTISAGSTLELRDGATGRVAGTLDNKGTLSVTAAGNLSDLLIEGATTFQGGGTVAMNGGNARIYSNTASSTLSNLDDTISGVGQIFSNNNLSFTNQTGGTVRAVGGTFDLHDIAVTNHGILEAGTGGTLFIRNAGLTSDATVRAIVSGGVVTLRNSTISGGTLTTANGGKMSFDSNAILDGTAGHAVTISAGSTLELRDGTSGRVAGILDNKGTLSVTAAGSLSDLLIEGATTFQGGGTVAMTGGNARIYSNIGGSLLTNADNTVVGFGQIFSNNNLSLQNQAGGTIRADDGTLSVNLSVSNAGTFSAASDGILNVNGLTSFSGGTLGGAYLVDAGGAIRLLNAASGIVTLDANAALGTGSFLGTQVGGTDIGINQSLTTITSGHALSLFAFNGAWSNLVTVSGSLNLNNDTYTSVAGLTIANGGGAGGFGTFATTVADNGTIVALGGTLVFAQAVTGTGGVTIGSMSTAQIGASFAATLTASFDGVVDAQFETLKIDNAGAFAGHIAVLQSDDRIDLAGVTATGAAYAAGDLVVKNGAATVATLHLDGNYTGRTFNVASDGSGGTYITLNTPPAAQNDTVTTAEDNAVTFDVRSNDSDDQATPATLDATVVAGPSHGTLVKNGNGTFTYTPVANYNGPDSFTYKDSDGKESGNVATVTVTVTPVNDAPVSGNDSYSTAQNTALVVGVPGVLGNDTDIEGSALTAVLVTGPAHGVVSLSASGSFTYTPTSGYFGSDSFTYRANDGTTSGNIATAALTVTQVVVPHLSVASTTGSANEGNAGQTAFTFTVTRSGDTSGATSVGYAAAGSGANPAAAADFAGGTFPTGNVSFSAGETSKTVIVNVAGDTAFEPNETFALTLSGQSGTAVIDTASATATIVNDDAAPVAHLSVGSASGGPNEGDAGATPFTFTVTRSGDTSGTTSVNYAVIGSGNFPAQGSDFVGGTFPTGSVIFAAGETSKVVTVNVQGDTVYETNDGFALTISGASGSAVIDTAAASATILNDDPQPVAHLSIAATTASANEGNAGQTAFTFTVTRSGDTSGATSVGYAVAGSGANPAVASDFAGGAFPSGTVSFAAGETSKTVTVNVAGDVGFEANEGFALTLSGPSGTAVIDTASAAATIVNDDAAPTGANTLILRVAEDAYQGDAQFVVRVDGVQVGGVQTATVRHGQGYQDIAVTGAFSDHPQSVVVEFINDLYGGTPQTDRNLYVDKLFLNGDVYEGEAGALVRGRYLPGEVLIGASRGTITFDTSDTLVLRVSEDAYQGDAQFVVRVDGQQVGGVQTATASHSAGQYQDITLKGNFGENPHNVVVEFVNDLYGGTPQTDRNLYIDKVTLNGDVFEGEAGQIVRGKILPGEAEIGASRGTLTLDVQHSLTLRVSEDAYQGDAQFVVKVDGQQVGGVQTVTALHNQGQYQDITVKGDFGDQPQNVTVQFINDLYGGTPQTDRNLYVDKLFLNGETFEGENGIVTRGYILPTEAKVAATSGAVSFNTGLDTLVFKVSEDAYQGDAQFIVKVDGVQLGGVQTATTSHSSGQYQDIVLRGDFDTSPHKVQVQFVNDLYGGTPQTDRNLYIDQFIFNEHVYEAERGQVTRGYTYPTEIELAATNGTLTFDHII